MVVGRGRRNRTPILSERLFSRQEANLSPAPSELLGELHHNGVSQSRLVLIDGLIVNDFYSEVGWIWRVPDVPTLAMNACVGAHRTKFKRFRASLLFSLGLIMKLSFSSAGIRTASPRKPSAIFSLRHLHKRSPVLSFGCGGVNRTPDPVIPNHVPYHSATPQRNWWICTDLNRNLTGCRPAALPLSYRPGKTNYGRAA
jgi:hypothetical protein